MTLRRNARQCASTGNAAITVLTMARGRAKRPNILGLTYDNRTGNNHAWLNRPLVRHDLMAIRLPFRQRAHVEPTGFADRRRESGNWAACHHSTGCVISCAVARHASRGSCRTLMSAKGETKGLNKCYFHTLFIPHTLMLHLGVVKNRRRSVSRSNQRRV